jgi:hypothetical protein
MADQAKLRKRLEALLKKPENQVCCDCNRRGARWASANLGNFFCIECSGIHRNLGVHISFVRSVNLDTWTVKQVEVRCVILKREFGYHKILIIKSNYPTCGARSFLSSWRSGETLAAMPITKPSFLVLR